MYISSSKRSPTYPLVAFGISTNPPGVIVIPPAPPPTVGSGVPGSCICPSCSGGAIPPGSGATPTSPSPASIVLPKVKIPSSPP